MSYESINGFFRFAEFHANPKSSAALVRTVSDWFGLVQTGLNCFRLVRTVLDCFRLVQTGSDWFRLVRTGSDWFGLVQTGSDWFELFQIGFDWFRLVQTGSDWFRLVQENFFQAKYRHQQSCPPTSVMSPCRWDVVQANSRVASDVFYLILMTISLFM